MLSLMAIVIGTLSTVVAAALVWLISVLSNFAFYQVYSPILQSPQQNRLGYLVIVVPILGGLIIGLMARYGSDKIRGHGIPEALEAILFGQLFHLSAAERKTLLVAGAAAGMSAIFASPIASILLAVELLLFEWKPRSFIPVAIASMVAGVMCVPFLGSGPMFAVTGHSHLRCTSKMPRRGTCARKGNG
jgi:chloride channel protein, CIC family